MASIKEQVNSERPSQQQSKYQEALSKYNCELNDTEIREKVKKLITEKAAENDTKEVKKFLFGSLRERRINLTAYYRL